MKKKTGAEQGIKLDLSKQFVRFSLTVKQQIKGLFRRHKQLSYADLMNHLPTVDLEEIVSTCEQLVKEGFIGEVGPR